MAVDWSNMHVTSEEYDATLRGSVNAYYEHAMNDPSMSEEEAVASTAQMSEEYLDAVDEFNAAQDNAAQTGEEAAAEVDESAGVDNDDGGVDDDGGLE